MIDEPRPTAQGELLGGRYRLLRPLDRGGTGVVHAARDTRIGCEVAVKMLHPSLLRDSTVLARFSREVELVARLQHANIVRVSDVGAADGAPFVVMELLSGESLAARIARAGPLAPHEVVSIGVQLLDALHAVHQGGVLHRDIKPGNVFLAPLATGEDLVKLLDFGLAVLREGRSPKLTQEGTVAGSPAYVAPERLLEQRSDVRTDVYGAGLCLYEALSGEPAFHAPNLLALHARILEGKRAPLAERRPDAPAALVGAIERAIAVDPSARYADAAAFAQALRAASAPEREAQPAAPRPVSPSTPSPRPIRWVTPVALVGLLALAGAGAVWALAAGDTGDRVAPRTAAAPADVERTSPPAPPAAGRTEPEISPAEVEPSPASAPSERSAEAQPNRSAPTERLAAAQASRSASSLDARPRAETSGADRPPRVEAGSASGAHARPERGASRSASSPSERTPSRRGSRQEPDEAPSERAAAAPPNVLRPGSEMLTPDWAR